MSEENQTLSFDEIKDIIHGLKMSGLSFVHDDRVRDYVGRLIERLPSSEYLLELSDNPDSLKNICKDIGEIMKTIELGSQRTFDFKARYESKKLIPPRYDILKWREDMRKADITRNLIKISEVAEKNEDYDLSDKLIQLAEKSVSKTITAADLKGIESCSMTKESQGLLERFRDTFTGGEGGKLQRQRRKDQKDKEKEDRLLYNKLGYLSRLLNSDTDSQAVRDYIATMPESISGYLDQYVQGIKGVEQQFLQQVQGLEQYIEQVRSSYEENAAFNFDTTPPEVAGSEEVSGTEGAEEREVDPQRDEQQSSDGLEQESEEPVQPQFQAGQDVMYKGYKAKVSQVNPNGSLLLQKYLSDGNLGSQSRPINPNDVKPVTQQTASSKIRLNKQSSRKWIRVV